MKAMTSTRPDTAREGGTGICVDATGAWITHGTPLSAGRFTLERRPLAEIPPSALVPRLPGEPIRLDAHYPPHIRGTGELWPIEARVSEECGAGGRMPAAYAWPAFAQPKAGSWRWRHDETESVLPPAQCLGALLVAAAGGGVASSSQPVCVIPDRFTMAAQQELIDAAWQAGANIRLLWRPVAAALAWCNGQQATADVEELAGGCLVTIHAGLDELEFAVLELVSKTTDGSTVLVPARRRPRLQPLPSFGLELLHRLASDTLKELGVPASPSARWWLLWCTPWIRSALDAVCERQPHGSSVCAFGEKLKDVRSAVHRRWDSLLSRLGTEEWRHLARVGKFFPRQDDRDLKQWLQEAGGLLAGKRLVGAVISGPLAAVPWRDGKQLGLWCLERLAPPLRLDRMLVERSAGSQLLADGAAAHASRLLLGQASYLDTLPRLRMTAYIGGRPCWIDLLRDTDDYVDGGKPWRRPEPVSGLKVNRGKDRLVLTVHHEEFPTVRRLVQEFPNQLEQDVRVRLDVSVSPAQGNAQIEVAPESSGALGPRKLFLEFRTMEDYGKSPADALAELPTRFPELLRRLASARAWGGAEREMKEYLAAPNIIQLRNVIARLKSRVVPTAAQPWEEQGRTAVSSEGVPGRASQVLDQFLDRLLRQQLVVDEQVRAVAYTATPDPRFQAWLHRTIHRKWEQLEQHELAGCGWCLRDPRDVASLAKAFIQRAAMSPEGNAHWLKAFAEILRYRQDALEQCSSEDCLRLAMYLLDVFDRQRKLRNGAFLFRYSSFAITYLLRRRAYDDDFLSPYTPEWRKISTSFAEAVQDIKARRLRVMGGSIDASAALLLMLRYLQKKGPSVLQGGAELAGLLGEH